MSPPVLFLLRHDPTPSSDPAAFARVCSIDRVDPGSPHVSVLDLGISRGDGVFESIGVVDGRIQALEPHLTRLATSARLLDLPRPDLDAWREAVTRAVQASDHVHELFVKLVLTRGIEGSDRLTGWVYAEPVGGYEKIRREGIRAVTLDRGYRSDVMETSPWLLQGAKTLSYAVNRAALREAARRGADDVIFVSSDGLVLEGPTSSVVALLDGVLVTTPSELGVLPGTTQYALFEYAQARGQATAYRACRVEELRRASALWLASSVRQLIPVVALDDVPVATDAPFTAGALAHLLGR